MSPKANASACPMCRSPEGYGNMSSMYLRGRLSAGSSVANGFVSSQTGQPLRLDRGDVVAVARRRVLLRRRGRGAVVRVTISFVQGVQWMPSGDGKCTKAYRTGEPPRRCDPSAQASRAAPP